MAPSPSQKLLSALERKERDLEKLQKLAELPRVQARGRWDGSEGGRLGGGRIS